MAKIKEIRCIRTRANGEWLVVKVITDQPGLYGIGSATDSRHSETIQTAIEQVIAPRMIGREATRIEDNWQFMHTHMLSSYWRNGPILNTAIGGIDVALWDIAGKEAGMPVYRLLGGPCRAAVPAYAHASGEDVVALEEDVRRYMEDGYQYIRCQLGKYGGGGFIKAEDAGRPKNAWPMDEVFDDEEYLENIPKMFDTLRSRLGFKPKLIHDAHEHLRPHNAVALAKLLEPYRLFFLEDALAPEQIGWYRLIRQQCTTPQAMGELFSNPQEWVPLITERLIDFIRVRVSKVGGITPARKIAALAECFGVNVAFQEGSTGPVNQMASLHLDMALWNFAVQEENHFRPEEYEVFPGHAVLEKGYLYPNDSPGLGIDIDEDKAHRLLNHEAMEARRYRVSEDRRADGTLVRP